MTPTSVTSDLLITTVQELANVTTFEIVLEVWRTTPNTALPVVVENVPVATTFVELAVPAWVFTRPAKMGEQRNKASANLITIHAAIQVRFHGAVVAAAHNYRYTRGSAEVRTPHGIGFDLIVSSLDGPDTC